MKTPCFCPRSSYLSNLEFFGQVEEAVKGAEGHYHGGSLPCFPGGIELVSPQAISRTSIIVGASKGIENDTLLTMEGVVREVVGPG